MSATATVAAPNGRAPRKQLSDQLDRLDTIIDVLAEGLPGAVADACREGARQAVKDAVVEILTNPELRALFDALRAGAAPVPVVPPPEPARAPGLWTRLKAKAAAARAAVTGAVVRVKEAVVSRVRAIRSAVSAPGALVGEPLPWRKVLWVGAGVGLVRRRDVPGRATHGRRGRRRGRRGDHERRGAGGELAEDGCPTARTDLT